MARLGMFAYYQKKEGGGQDPSPCPGGRVHLPRALCLTKNKEGGGQALTLPGGSGKYTYYLQSFTGLIPFVEQGQDQI